MPPEVTRHDSQVVDTTFGKCLHRGESKAPWLDDCLRCLGPTLPGKVVGVKVKMYLQRVPPGSLHKSSQLYS